MIHCPRCGAEIPPGSVFCMRCGTRIRTLPQESPRGFHSSWLKKAVIPLGAIAIFSVLALAVFPGEQDLCRGIVCNDECRGTTLWKMKCVEGECIPDYLLEKDSEECGFVPPSETPEPPIDSDSDGIIDSVDDCYNPGCTTVDSRGCPIDADGDGLSDCYDDCPRERGEKTNKGCPVAEVVVHIEISAVNYNAPGDDNDNPNGEWVRISNTGNQDVNMAGWKLYDDAYKRGTAPDHVFVFPSRFILRAGQSVTIYTGQGINTGSNLYFGRPPREYAAIWNNDGDCAYLVDNQGKLIDRYCW